MRGGAVVLATLLVLTAAVALVQSPGRAPDAGRETTYWLAVESVAVDGDQWFEARDRARFERRFGAPPVDVQIVLAGDQKHLDAPWLWTRLAALSWSMAGRSGVTLLQLALFAWTVMVAAATLASRIGGGGASRLVALALFASAAFAVPFRFEPRALELAAMATAAAAVWYRRLGAAKGADDVYRGDLTGRPASWRWLVAGLCAAPVVAATPAYLPLLAPLLAAAPAARRGRAALLFGAGVALVLAPLLRFIGAPWEAIEGAASAALYGWSAVGLLVGRGVGVVVYFLPALGLVSLGGRGDGKSYVFPAVVAAVALQLALAPFDFVEGGLAPGNAWFLAPLALLLVAAESSESPRASLAMALVALPWIAAAWLTAVGAPSAAAAVARRVAAVERLLPAASTLRLQPGSADLVRGGLRARGFAPGLAGARDGKLRVVEERADLVVTADRPLSSVRLELGAEAPARLDVRGGKLGNTILRPSGEVAIDVAVDPARARRHPVWWSRESAWSYPLEIRLASRPRQPVVIDLPFGRLAVPEGESP